MSHQPYEDWILSTTPLDPKDQQSLNSHLQSCPQCDLLADGMEQVLDLFSSHPAPGPTSGFTQRWRKNYAEYHHKKQQRVMWIFSLSLLSLSVLIFTGLALLEFSTINWSFLLSQWIATISLVVIRGRQWLTFIDFLAESFPIIIPILSFIFWGLLASLFGLTVFWFTSIVNLFSPKNLGGTVR